MRRRVIGVDRDRLIEIVDRLADSLAGSLVGVEPPSEVQIIPFKVLVIRLHDRPGKLDPQGVGDGAGNLVLYGEHIFRLPAINLGPQITTVRHSDQLCGDPQSIALAADTSFQYRSHVQLLADLLEVASFAFELEG